VIWKKLTGGGAQKTRLPPAILFDAFSVQTENSILNLFPARFILSPAPKKQVGLMGWETASGPRAVQAPPWALFFRPAKKRPRLAETMGKCGSGSSGSG
jgi:hypothetical protein